MKYDIFISKLFFQNWKMPNGEIVKLKYRTDSDIYIACCGGWENISLKYSVLFEISRSELIKEGWIRI